MHHRFARPGLVLAAFGLWLAGGAAPLAAAEAYVCGPNKLVYVEAGELEQKKRTDPCIAAYYGLTVEAPSAAAPQAAKPIAAQPETADLALKPASLPDPAAVKPARHAAMMKPVFAAPGTDFRNVRVLNASSSSEAWYRHTK